MLYQLGNCQFEIIPVNVHEFQGDAESSYASKEVLGRRPPLEFVGEGPETATLTGKIFPDNYGGLSGLDALNKQRAQGVAVPLVRGDGVSLGWFRTERVTAHHTYLAADGVGKVVEFSVALKRDDPPSAEAIAMILFAGLFG